MLEVVGGYILIFIVMVVGLFVWALNPKTCKNCKQKGYMRYTGYAELWTCDACGKDEV